MHWISFGLGVRRCITSPCDFCKSSDTIFANFNLLIFKKRDLGLNVSILVAMV